jgi:hypothetical protein
MLEDFNESVWQQEHSSAREINGKQMMNFGEVYLAGIWVY